MMNPIHRREAGFTLVELAIVLAIIGLIAGGITTGTHLVRQSEINSLQMQVGRVGNAVTLFREKYTATPGELYTYAQFFPQLVGSYCPKATFDNHPDGLINDDYENEAAFA